MEDIIKILGYASILSVCGVIILRMIRDMIQRKSLPASRTEPTQITDIDPLVDFPADLLRSYRLAIDNSATTMACLTYLASHQDAIEDELVAEVTRKITKTKPPSSVHVRHVLLALFASYFVSIRNSTCIYLTSLGGKALESITQRDQNPPATRKEITGYRSLISNNVLHKTILSILREKHSLPKTELIEMVTEVYKNNRMLKVPPPDRIEQVVMNSASFGWITDDGNACTISEMGKRVFDDLHF